MEKKVLIAEDSPTVQHLLKFYLNELRGVKVTFARNGLEAMIKLDKGEFDMLITDIVMPLIDGFKLISFVRNSSRLKNIPIIIITQKGKEKDCRQGIYVGANAYFVKPINKNEFKDKIIALLHDE